MSWETVGEEEKAQLLDQLKAATGFFNKTDEESWFKCEWENVPELVERRQVLLKRGKAYVHVREQLSMVVNEFSRQLESGLELAARFLPRMDEDNRLAPILHHLSQSFVAPDAGYSEDSSLGDITNVTAASIDSYSQHFPLCMQNLHRELKKNSHLKHFSRLQYTLFLKGLGLNLQECILFWRRSFKLITDGELFPTVAAHSLLMDVQTNSNPNTFTTFVTLTVMSVVMQIDAGVATHPTVARNCSLSHCPPVARIMVALIVPTVPTT